MINPYDDIQTVKDFCDDNWEHCIEWCEEKNLNPNHIDNMIAYCEFYENDFLQYSYEKDEECYDYNHEDIDEYL